MYTYLDNVYIIRTRLFGSFMESKGFFIPFFDIFCTLKKVYIFRYGEVYARRLGNIYVEKM